MAQRIRSNSTRFPSKYKTSIVLQLANGVVIKKIRYYLTHGQKLSRWKIQLGNVFKLFNKTKARRSTHAEAGSHDGVPFTMSRYTLPSFVAREAPGRGKNKHNLNASCSPRLAPRIRESNHGRSTPVTLPPVLPRLKRYNITISHTNTSRCRNDSAMQLLCSARARAQLVE